MNSILCAKRPRLVSTVATLSPSRSTYLHELINHTLKCSSFAQTLASSRVSFYRRVSFDTLHLLLETIPSPRDCYSCFYYYLTTCRSEKGPKGSRETFHGKVINMVCINRSSMTGEVLKDLNSQSFCASLTHFTCNSRSHA